MSDLRRAFYGAWKAAEDASWIAGVLGRVNPDGSVTVDVANRPTFVYVRVGATNQQTTTIARDAYSVPRRANLPVKMKREGNQLVVYAVDMARFEAATAGDTSTLAFGVPKHTHRLGTGLEYEIEALRLEPGRVRWYGGLNVYIGAFRYFYDGAWDTWPGGDIDLTAYKPAASGEWAWVLVGIDPATNTAVAVAGTSQTYATPLTIDLIDAIAFGDYIPCVAVRVRNDDTVLSDTSRYVDAHGWFNRGADLAATLQANTLTRLATVGEIDATALGATELYVVPVGKSLVVDRVVVRCTDFTIGSKTIEAIASFGGNSPDYDDYLTSLTWTIAAADMVIVESVTGVAFPVYAAATSIRVSVETASDAAAETWAVDVFGYLL